MRTKALPAAALVVVGSAFAGGLLGSRVIAKTDRITERYRMYTAAVAAIETDYVEPIDSAPLIYGSIDGMLRTLDPHSTFFDPKAYAQLRERQEGHYFGIGISIASVDGDITVASLFEGSPAYKQGIRRGDIVAKVGTDDTKGWSTDDVVKRIKGPKGTTVDISIRRPGVDALIPLTVERDEINIVTVRTAYMIQSGTGYIRLQEFSETSNEEIGVALKKLQGQGMQRLVLDLRDNPGGALDQAIGIASRFLHRGQMVVETRGRIAHSDENYPATDEGNFGFPMIVMVNRNSASASEIVTGAMQDHDRAYVIGETTFGKALVQSVYNISEGAGLALTTAHYYTPSGRLIQRPWDGSFDEYLTYTLRDQGANRAHPASELKYTDGGRKVYGGGGIEPDHFIAGAFEGFNPTQFSRGIYSRGVFINFAERFTKEGDTRAGAKSAATHKVAAGWQVDDAMMKEFHDYLVSLHVKVDEEALKTDDAFLRAMIKNEVDSDLFGFEAARQNLEKVDPQIAQALNYFSEADKLLQLKKDK
jgi:carboxyl-terminal processing protease